MPQPEAHVTLVGSTQGFVVVAGRTALAAIAAFASALLVLVGVQGYIEVTRRVGSVGNITGAMLTPLEDAAGVAFSDGNGSSFFIFQ